jgi:rabenosyn-5
LYEKIIEIRRDIEPDIPMYSKIVNSLYEGSSTFKLSDASALREKIGRSAENIDQISRHILSLQFAPGSREEALKKAIRLSCVSYIKERMLEIPPLPLEEEIRKLQVKRSQEIADRIERERQMAMEAYDRYELHSDSREDSSSASKVVSTFSTMDNWSSYQSKATQASHSDPLIEQINIIKGYIRQAREAMRFEEVATLEMNLNELKQEFYNRQLQQQNTNQ